MKIFYGKYEFNTEKINFVDVNNVFVGYSTDTDCCEYADWFISDKESNEIIERVEELDELPDYIFDVDYFEEVTGTSELDMGGMVRFRLVNGDSEKFLHLFNCHNGYYGHGFSFGVNETLLREGCL